MKENTFVRFISICWLFGVFQLGGHQSSPGLTQALELSTEPTLQSAIDWIKTEPFESLIPKANARSIVEELLSDKSLIDDAEDFVVQNVNWSYFELRYLYEEQTVETILGPDLTDRLLDVIEEFWRSGFPLKILFRKIMYDGIDEFSQTMGDDVGNIVNSVPIIGPIIGKLGKHIIADRKRALIRSRHIFVRDGEIAIEKAIDSRFPPVTTETFISENVNLAKRILEQRVSSFFPFPTYRVYQKIWKNVFDYIRNDIDMETVDRYLDIVYAFLGDITIESVVNVDRFLEASPTLKDTVSKLWENAVQSSSENMEKTGYGAVSSSFSLFA